MICCSTSPSLRWNNLLKGGEHRLQISRLWQPSLMLHTQESEHLVLFHHYHHHYFLRPRWTTSEQQRTQPSLPTAQHLPVAFHGEYFMPYQLSLFSLCYRFVCSFAVILSCCCNNTEIIFLLLPFYLKDMTGFHWSTPHCEVHSPHQTTCSSGPLLSSGKHHYTVIF